MSGRDERRCRNCRSLMGWADIQGYCSKCWAWIKDTRPEITCRGCSRVYSPNPYGWLDERSRENCPDCGEPPPTRLAFGLDRAPAKERTCAMWPTLAQLEGRRAAAENRVMRSYRGKEHRACPEAVTA